jgi:hypothetical protein
MLHQVKSCAMVVRFMNQLKATFEDEERERNVRSEIEAVIATHQYGTPVREHFRRNRGACLIWATPKR